MPFFTPDSVYIDEVFAYQEFLLRLSHIEPGFARFTKMGADGLPTGGFFNFHFDKPSGLAEFKKKGIYKVYSERDRTWRPTDPAALDQLTIAFKATQRRADEEAECMRFIAELAVEIQQFLKHGHGG